PLFPCRNAAQRFRIQRDVRDVVGIEQLVDRREVAGVEHLLHEPTDDDLEDVRGHGALSLSSRREHPRPVNGYASGGVRVEWPISRWCWSLVAISRKRLPSIRRIIS